MVHVERNVVVIEVSILYEYSVFGPCQLNRGQLVLDWVGILGAEE